MTLFYIKNIACLAKNIKDIAIQSPASNQLLFDFLETHVRLFNSLKSNQE